MKKANNFISMIAFSTMILFSLQSCSVGGLIVGSMMDSTDDTNYDEPVKSGEGWISPDHRNNETRILMNNGKSLKGKYEGTEQIYNGDDFVDVILIKINNQIKRVPLGMIAYTKIYKKNKDHTQSGFLVGFGIDLFIVAIVVVSGGLSFSPGWSGPI